MAITFLSATNDGDFTLAVPAGTVDGDLLLVTVCASASGSAPTITDPGGWSTLGDEAWGTFPVFRARTLYRVASGEPASYTWTTSGIVQGSGIASYRGVDTATPMDATATHTSNVGSVPNTPSISTVTNDAWVLSLLNAGAAPASAPSGMTDRGIAIRFSLADVARPTLGAYDPGDWGTGATSWAGWSIALHPSTVVVTPYFWPIHQAKQAVNRGSTF